MLRTLRARGKPVPVLVITGRDGLEHLLLGLDAGTDDNILKPFEMAKLLARMRCDPRQGAAYPGRISAS